MEFINVCLKNTDELHLSTDYISHTIKLFEIQEISLGNVVFNSSTCNIELIVDVNVFREAIKLLLGDEIHLVFIKDENTDEQILNLKSYNFDGSSNLKLTDQKGSGLKFKKFQVGSFRYNFQKLETILKYVFSNSINILFTLEGVLKCRHHLLPNGYLDFILGPQIEL